MAAADKTAKFSIDLEGSIAPVSKEMADKLAALQAKIQGSTKQVKDMSAALRNLRGSSAEVVAAKEQLKAKIGAAKDAISGATTELVKLNGAQLISAKAANDNALSFSGLKAEIVEATGAIGVAVGAALAFTGVLGVLGVSLASFILKEGDAARSLQLTREAFAGTAENAKHLGQQIDDLSTRVPISKDKLNELGTQLMRTRLSGQAIVDTMNVVGQASAAMGDDVGRSLQDIITRGAAFNRFQLSPLELQSKIGPQVQFKDVAKQLALQMHIGVKQAQQALFEGRVKTADGAKALRAAVEAQFGALNAKKLLSIDSQLNTFKNNLQSLVKDVDLEPLLRGFSELVKMFDSSSVSGYALHALLTTIGNGLVGAFVKSLPLMKKFFLGMVIGALQVTLAFLKLKKFISESIPDSWKDKINGANVALIAGKVAVYALAAGLVLVAASFAAIVGVWVAFFAPLIAVGVAVYKVIGWIGELKDFIKGIDWAGLGHDMLMGLVNGIKSAAGAVASAVSGVATDVKDTFKHALGISSPSKVFSEYGKQTGLGYQQGLDRSSSAETATAALTPAAPSGYAAGGGRGNGYTTVNVSINVKGGEGKNVAKQLSEPSFLASLTKAIEDALKTQGIPAQ